MGCNLGPGISTESRRQSAEHAAAPCVSTPTKTHVDIFANLNGPLASVPPLLNVSSPNGQRSCAGRYVLTDAEKANGKPVWKLEDRNRWLFYSREGMWLIGGPDIKAANFSYAAGFIYSLAVTNGALPDQVPGAWRWWDGIKFQDDIDITVTAGKLHPLDLQRKSYETAPSLVSEAMEAAARILPVKTPTIPVTPRSPLPLRDGAASATPMTLPSRSVSLTSTLTSAGALSLAGVQMPDEGIDDGPVDPSESAPKTLQICSPNGQESCAGDYELVHGALVNGQPFWKSISSERWLYSSRRGKWMVGGSDARNEGFKRSAGYIFCEKAHEGETPECFSGAWNRWDGTSFHPDDDIVVSIAQDVM